MQRSYIADWFSSENQSAMPFIFKGDTCLMLLMEHPCRLSTDIDIIAEPGTDLDKYLDRASEIFPFIDRVAWLTQRLLYTADWFPFESQSAFLYQNT